MPTELCMPKLGETMLEGLVLRWLAKEGDRVVRGQPLLEVETDKAVSEVASAAAGRLLKVLAPEGTAVKVGEAYAIIIVEESLSEELSPRVETGRLGDEGFTSSLSTQPSGARLEGSGGTRIQATPKARNLARERGIPLEMIAGSGPGGMVVERDVEQAVAATTGTAAPKDEMVKVVPLVGARKLTAERMLQSRLTTAQVTTFMDVDVSRVGDLRREIGATYTAFVVKAVARTLPEFPYLNASLEGERILLRKGIHIGVAVDAGDALLVPVIRHADRKSLVEIVQGLNMLAERGRRRELAAEEMQGGTFTVTNPGVFGALFSTPIINLPQTAILGTGRVSRAAVVRDDAIAIGEMMYLSLSYDHRVVDGGPAVRFLRAVKELLENPAVLVN